MNRRMRRKRGRGAKARSMPGKQLWEWTHEDHQGNIKLKSLRRVGSEWVDGWVSLHPTRQTPLCRAMLRFKDDKGVQKRAADAMLIPKITWLVAGVEVMQSLTPYYQFRSLAAPRAPNSLQ